MKRGGRPGWLVFSDPQAGHQKPVSQAPLQPGTRFCHQGPRICSGEWEAGACVLLHLFKFFLVGITVAAGAPGSGGGASGVRHQPGLGLCPPAVAAAVEASRERPAVGLFGLCSWLQPLSLALWPSSTSESCAVTLLLE